MNLYTYHNDPKSLNGFEDARKLVPDLAFDFAQSTSGLYPAGEKAISRDALCSYYYAIAIVGGRFLPGEKAIAKDPYNSYWYAVNLLKHRFEKGEPSMRPDNGLWTNYCKSFKIPI